ncbi:hypothetical protein TNCV_3882561 [Trichonephila clavipes]|nr:hypothetical protein TNCV_3882561 [Trichonephila clavipes]
MPVVGRSYEHHTCNSTTFSSVPHQFRGRPAWEGIRGLSPPSSSTNLMRGPAVQWLFRVSPSRKGFAHLQTSITSPRFVPRPYSTATSVTSHYTG